MLITDAQVHIYPPDTPETPWPKEVGRSAPPAKHADCFTAEQMLGAMEAVGVDRAVIVPPVWAGESLDYALAAASRHEGRFAVAGRVDPYAADAPERLEHWLERPHIVGIRMSGRWASSPKSVAEAFEDPELEWYWSACARLGIPIMVLPFRFVPAVVAIARRHPDLPLIIDHLGIQPGETLDQAFGAIADLEELARSPRAYIKVGNGPNRSRQAFPFEDVHPYLRRIYDAFGARRMLWEADLTQLTKNTYAECLRLWQEGLPFLSSEDKDWILGRTAAEVLSWPEK
jgi:predicted TIM-barrel fold metal-dependent hydrolase